MAETVILMHGHYDGGPGSGNWGHEGVPGQVGGSASSGKRSEGYERQLLTDIFSDYENVINEAYERMANYLCSLDKAADATDFIGDVVDANLEYGYEDDEAFEFVETALTDFVDKTQKEAKDARVKADFIRDTEGEVGIASPDELLKLDKIAQFKQKLADKGQEILSQM